MIMNIEEKYLTDSAQRDSRKYKAVDNKWYLEIGVEGGGWNDSVIYGPFDTKEVADEYIHKNFRTIGGFWLDASGIRPVPNKVIKPKK